MINVAMDVHVRNSFLKARDGQGRRLASGRVGNRLGQLAEKLGPVERAAVGESQPVRVVMESTSNSRAVRELLARWGQAAGIDLTVEVLDARQLRIIAASTAKCDRLDTQMLLELAESRLRLPRCYVPDGETFALREHLRGRADLVRVRTMMKNRVHALLHRRGILKPARMDLFSKRGRQFLSELELDEAGGLLRGQYLEAIDQLDQLLNDSERELKRLAGGACWRASVNLLNTMPGVGLVTAMTILAELGEIDRFRSRAAVSNYAGLVPRVRQSNEKRVHGGLICGGNRQLRQVMVEAAWRAARQVPAYESIFNRVAARRGKPIAIVAVARRMLEDAWTMLKRREPFRYGRSSDRTSASSVQADFPLA